MAPSSRCDKCNCRLKKKNVNGRCGNCIKFLKPWRESACWTDLVDLNREYIREIVKLVPYAQPSPDDQFHNRPQLVSGVLRLHDLGIIVTHVMPSYGSTRKNKRTGKWERIESRAYLRCVIPTNNGDLAHEARMAVCDNFLENPELEVTHFADEVEYSWLRAEETGLFYKAPPRDIAQDGPIPTYFRSTAGKTRHGRTLARYKIADTEEELRVAKWKRCEAWDFQYAKVLDLPPDSTGKRALGERCKGARGMDIMVVEVAARSFWQDCDLVDQLERLWKMARLATIFL